MNCKKVVIADTDISSRLSLAEAIDKSEHLVLAAQTNDGKDLVEICRSMRCDIVVMELCLPTMDALEVLDRLRELPIKPFIIVLSGFSAEYIAKLCIDHGADYLMLRPCNPGSVVNRIEQIVLERSQKVSHYTNGFSVEVAVTEAMHRLGIPSHVKGYQYLREAILLAVEDVNMIDCITKLLYPQIAKKYATTACGVERAIRHAIALGWERGDPEIQQQFLGYSLSEEKHKPTNSEFIALIADKLQLQLKSAEVGNF